ncbi:MAG: penicillin-binding protein [Lachnospiraceae bacterium]|nr:penicillin-binding protein [Lachnospiraceae bacterium]
MFDDFKDYIINMIKSRLTIFSVIFIILAGILVKRCFELQIVRGDEYLDSFMLQTEKIKDISASRGNIYDCNGNLLAYNKLAYSVKIEDIFENGREKNAKVNEIVYMLIKMIEKNNDKVVNDFKIIVDDDGNFAYSVEGTSLLRFLADVYGYKTIDKLDENQRKMTADQIMEYLSRYKGFAIGEYENPEEKSGNFIPGKGYSKEDWLKIVNIRYNMSLTSYRKYIGTTVATDVNDKTVAVIMENSKLLKGAVYIEEDTVRKYEDSKYFAHVLGYVGKISSEELTALNEEAGQDLYTINDVVGKKGIEQYMERELQGVKGYEKVIVDNTGKVRSVLDNKNAEPGNNVYLTIDKDLTIAAYNIVEQKLAGMISSKIINTKEYNQGANSKSSDIKIPIYDVYFAFINNSILNIKHFASEDAGEGEKYIYEKYCAYKDETYNKLRKILVEKDNAYSGLSKEYQVYETNIVTLLKKNNVLMSEVIDENDETQVAWAKDESIGLKEYLEHCIKMNWIDVSKLTFNSKYTDTEEIYLSLVDSIIEMIDDNTEFQKKFYKYMLLNDRITGEDICKAVCEQGCIEVSIEDERALYSHSISAYQFMKNRIDNIDVTPAQLALDPCNASVVIADVNTGETKAVVSYPGYDNNKMANSVDPEYYAKLITDKATPEYNFATQYKAAPGSTFKIVSATAGLMEGVIDLGTTVICKGVFTEVNPNPRCWKITGHGAENVSSAIKDSCNYFFYNVGYLLSTVSGSYNESQGLESLRKYAEMFGLSEKSGIEISEETPEVSDRYPVVSAIGQGTNSYTTAGLARYAAAIANRGTVYDLTLLKKVCDADNNTIKEYSSHVRNKIEIPDEYWDAIHTGMRNVVENKSYFSDLAVNVAGKTGTAEQSKSRPNHALFICFAPYEKPELSIATRIVFGYSSDYAAQITRDIIKYYYGLADENEIITGTADTPDTGIANEF